MGDDNEAGVDDTHGNGAGLYQGCIANVALGIGNFTTKHHVFVQETVGYPLVLGQPWRARLRYTSAWRADGGEMGQITSPDGERTVRFTVVDRSDEGGHRAYLRKRPKAAPLDFERHLREVPVGHQGREGSREGDTDDPDFYQGRP